MQFTPGIKQYPAVRTTALTILLSGQQPLTAYILFILTQHSLSVDCSFLSLCILTQLSPFLFVNHNNF